MTGHASPRIAALGTLAATALLLTVSAPGAAALDRPIEPGAVQIAADAHPDPGTLLLGSAALAAGAGTIGLVLLRRRRTQDADSAADRSADGRS
jgi:hypothetical protein